MIYLGKQRDSKSNIFLFFRFTKRNTKKYFGGHDVQSFVSVSCLAEETLTFLINSFKTFIKSYFSLFFKFLFCGNTLSKSHEKCSSLFFEFSFF